ncbi:MAG: hypothetical protein NC081_05525 [Roseburia sp.]|nr:hypothetical protein [Lachnospiraceae bacterium]MCM1568893.1 hypothetical protein [Roseburia sp.]
MGKTEISKASIPQWVRPLFEATNTLPLKKYFELPQLGELFRVWTFYKLDGQPILFVCVDGKGQKYLCSCCMMYSEWLVCDVSDAVLLSLVNDEISIREVFERHSSSLLFVTWDGKLFNVTGEIPADAFPEDGALLELKDDYSSNK